MIKNIIFDFDGVLVDSEVLVSRAFTKYLNNAGFSFKKEEFADFAGKKTTDVISILSNKFSIKNEKIFFDDIMLLASNIYSNELETVNGVNDFIEKCELNLFIGSNSIKNRILDGLKKVKLDRFFLEHQIYSFDMVQHPKPLPDIYLKAIFDNNLKKDQTLIIEDSCVGVKAGVAAGVRVIGLTAGGHWFNGRNTDELYEAGATKVINSYKELLKIIKNY